MWNSNTFIVLLTKYLNPFKHLSSCTSDFVLFIFCLSVCRDSAYIAVLTSVLSDALTSPTFDLDLLYENSIALVALEEVIGVREPRLACTKGYQTALRNTVQMLTQKGQTEVSVIKSVETVRLLLIPLSLVTFNYLMNNLTSTTTPCVY